MSSIEQSAPPPTLFQVLRPASGYWLVSIACTCAGYSISHANIFPPLAEVPYLIAFWLLLIPALVSRAAVYEQRRLHNLPVATLQWLKNTFAVQVPIVLGVIWAVHLSWLLIVDRTTFAASSGRLIASASAALPLFCFGGYLVRHWPTNSSLFDFTFRTFFPAVATCLPAFVFGHSLNEGYIHSVVISIMVMVFWMIALRTSTRRLALIGIAIYLAFCAVFCGIVLAQEGPLYRLIIATSFGMILTIAMGVSESWRITSRVLKDEEFHPSGRYTQSIKNYYLGGVNIATAVFLPFSLLTVLHPSTNASYVFLLTFLLFTQYILWFSDNGPTKPLPWSSIGIASGLLLPGIISFGTHTSGLSYDSLRILTIENLRDQWAVILGLVTGIGYLCRHLMPVVSQIRDKSVSVTDGFLSVTNCITLTGVISGVLATIASLIQAGPVILSTGLSKKFSLLSYTYSLVTLICIAASYIMTNLRNGPDRTNTLRTDGADYIAPPKSEKPFVRGLTLLTRPLTSLLPGLLAGGLVSSRISIGNAAGVGLLVTAVTMLAFVANDIFDIKKDSAAGAEKAIPTKLISISSAYRIALCLLSAIAIIAGNYFPYPATVLTWIALVVGYSPFAQKYPMAKGFYAGILSFVPFWSASLLFPEMVQWPLYLMLFVFIVAREAYIDAHQLDTDLRANFRTIAVKLGASLTRHIAARVMLVSTIGLALVTQNWTSRLVALTAALSVILIFEVYSNVQERAGTSRLTMFLATVAIVLSGFTGLP